MKYTGLIINGPMRGKSMTCSTPNFQYAEPLLSTPVTFSENLEACEIAAVARVYYHVEGVLLFPTGEPISVWTYEKAMKPTDTLKFVFNEFARMAREEAKFDAP